MSDELPDPLVGDDVDLRGYPYTPIFRARLFGSSFHARSTDAEWRAGVTLWLKSWDQVPAGTLPDDDVDLCRLAELGRDVKTWRKLKPGAMRGWFKASDGRMHHEVVAEGVLEAWQRFSSAREKGKAAARKRWSTSNTTAIENNAQGSAQANTDDGTGTAKSNATATAQAMPGDANRREEKGREEKKGRAAASTTESVAEPSALNPAAALPSESARSPGLAIIELFDRLQVQHFAERRRQTPDSTDLVFATRWLASGLTIELGEHVIGSVFARISAAGKSPPRSLKYLDGAVNDALAEAALPLGASAAPPNPDSEHRARLAEALKRGRWFSNIWGAGPWEESYPAKHILAEFPAEAVAALKPIEGVPDIPAFLDHRGKGAAA